MQLPDELKRAGVIGTSDAKQVLRGIAVHSIQRRAGYVPSVLPESAYLRQINDERPVTPTQSTSQLYRMLLGQFQFANCLPEWCLLVAEHGMRMPNELIPSMLNSDLIFRDWHKLILLAMGSYARWIAAHQQEQHRWQWVIQTSMPRFDEIYADIEERSNKRIERYEKNRDKVVFHRRLVNHHYFWSDDLAEIALDYLAYVLHHKPFHQWRIDIERFHESFAYYAPLKYHEHYSELLATINEMQASNFDISMITAYRAKLYRIISEDATKVQASFRGRV